LQLREYSYKFDPDDVEQIGDIMSVADCDKHTAKDLLGRLTLTTKKIEQQIEEEGEFKCRER